MLEGAAFKTCAERVLAPELRPGDIVIVDTASAAPIRPAHKVKDARRAIEQAGATPLFLPPVERRSTLPDFNPIAMAFAKLKAPLKAAAARTASALHEAIAAALDRLTPDACHNDFAAAGYDPE